MVGQNQIFPPPLLLLLLDPEWIKIRLRDPDPQHCARVREKDLQKHGKNRYRQHQKHSKNSTCRKMQELAKKHLEQEEIHLQDMEKKI